jgi:D-alanyl-D-alanine carboxypeptidase
MPNHARKPHYRINWGMVIITLVMLVGVIIIIWQSLKLLDGGESPSSGGDPAPSSELQNSSLGSEAGGENSSAEEPDSSMPSAGSSSSQGSVTVGGKDGETAFSRQDGRITITAENGTTTVIEESEIPAGNLSDWNLILLNHKAGNEISEEIGFTKTKFDTQYCDSRAASAYQKMYDAAKQAGITLYLRSGYRTISEQRTNYNNNVQRLLNQGLSREEAIRQTNLYYTVPGHSEHHSGLAFDIITPEYHTYVYTLSEAFAETDAYTWLVEHCTDYGFILRYPKEKTAVTEINYEPWHYRYVGVDHAKFMEKYGLCFEEYAVLLALAGR